MRSKRSPTTKDIALLHQLYLDGQLTLAPEFQRNNVWPRPAKAYLIDTILKDRPMPLFFFLRGKSAQSGRPTYSVIDGQQRLRAIFEFLDDRFALTESEDTPYHRKRFAALPPELQDQIRNYDLVVEELSAYTETDIRDIFVRMNKYVVKLSPQELRHARESGAFYKFAEDLGKWHFWREHRVFTPAQLTRMKAVELSAELIILLIEGPQDKKSSVDLYYGRYQNAFHAAKDVRRRLEIYRDWILEALPDLRDTRYRKPVDFYALIGALDRLAEDPRRFAKISRRHAGDALKRFEELARPSEIKDPSAARYVVAASRQTDNIAPRETRISILQGVIQTA